MRSTKSETFASRQDVLFQNVKALKLPTALDGLVVAEADPTDAARISAETGSLPSEDTTIFTIRAGTFDGYVVAGVCVTAEDTGEYFEPSRIAAGSDAARPLRASYRSRALATSPMCSVAHRSSAAMGSRRVSPRGVSS
jgi:hypothetical protein